MYLCTCIDVGPEYIEQRGRSPGARVFVGGQSPDTPINMQRVDPLPAHAHGSAPSPHVIVDVAFPGPGHGSVPPPHANHAAQPPGSGAVPSHGLGPRVMPPYRSASVSPASGVGLSPSSISGYGSAPPSPASHYSSLSAVSSDQGSVVSDHHRMVYSQQPVQTRQTGWSNVGLTPIQPRPLPGAPRMFSMEQVMAWQMQWSVAAQQSQQKQHELEMELRVAQERERARSDAVLFRSARSSPMASIWNNMMQTPRPN